MIDSRVSAQGDVIRRRRECEACERRFRDIVFADELDKFGFRVAPKILPSVGMADLLGPFLRCGNVADGSVEPDIKDFSRISRDGNAPIGVAGDGARLQIIDVARGKMNYVFFPIFFANPLG